MGRLEPRHPLLGRSTPSIADLLERSSPAARQVLKAAEWLARWRIAGARKIEVMEQELRSDPWPATLSAPPAAEAVESGDLLRALVAERPADVAAVLFGGPTPEYETMSEGWKRIVQAGASVAATSPLTLEPCWGRRWALAAVRGLTSIDVPNLIASLDESAMEALMAFSATYSSGDSTLAEAQANAKATLAAGGAPGFEAVSHAYLDRHGGLAELDEALRTAPGVVLIGPQGSGRRALAFAWDELSRAGKASLPGHRATVDPFNELWEGNEHEWEAVAKRPVVLLLTSVAKDAHARRVADRFGNWAAEGHKARVVVPSTPDALDALYSAVPSARNFAEVRVPAIEDLDRLPLWMCHAIDDPNVGLDQAVGAITELDPAEVRKIDPWDLASLFRGKLGFAKLRPRGAYVATGWVARYLRGTVSDRYLESPRGQFVRAFVGSPERLNELGQLDRRLREGGIKTFS